MIINKVGAMHKKIANIAVVFVLLVSTGGISLTRHYCGDSLVSSALFSTPERCCDDGCSKCHDEHSFSKLTDDFTPSNSDYASLVQATLYHFAAIGVQSVNQWSAKPLSTAIELRKFLVHEAGEIPAFLGSFRC